MTRRMETPILIVGGGPIGLTLALDLGWRGIRCLLIEQGDGSIDLPRGAMVAARTMEFCRRWGIKERIVHSGFPHDYKLDMVFCTSLAGYLLERDEYPCERDQRPPPESPEKRTWCPQLLFDPTIARSAAELDEREPSLSLPLRRLHGISRPRRRASDRPRHERGDRDRSALSRRLRRLGERGAQSAPGSSSKARRC